uniref:PRP39 pre-mRNA processing factor 39 homolog (yeast) n=1 Tax=Cyprinus carpio TaxID=7962 RepID=A0A8C1TBD8_CYPCA
MEAAGVDYVTQPTATDWTVAQAPPVNPESHEQIQQASASEQHQMYSTEQLTSAAESDDHTAGPSDPSVESSGQQPESNGQHMELDAARQTEAGDLESPSNMELEDAPKETPEAVEPATDAAAAQDPALPAEYERLFKVVEDNPEDFNGWVYLLQYVEQENHLEASRKAFDAFFLHYPYCYGYWKKYADIEKKHGYIHMADEVYRRGLQAIPLSVDLWLHYITFLRENQDTSDGEAENRIRATLCFAPQRVTEIENMRHKVIETRQEVFNHNEHEVSKRWAFEEGVSVSDYKHRLYFLIPPRLPKALKFSLIKYAKYLESYSVEGVRHIFKKACTVHLPKKPTVHLLWAAFEEQQGSVEEARGILKAVEEAVPGLAMVRLRRVSLERRHGNMDEAEALLRDGITNGKNSSESSFYAVKLARQLVKVQKSIGKAKKVLLEAVEKDETNPKLYLNLLELEYSGDVQQNEAEILACFDRALSSPMSLEQRLTFSQRKVEFLEDFGSDINVLVAAYEQHQRLVTEQESLKRKSENGSEEPDSKRQRTDDQSGASGQMMQDMQANHAGYNYNNWYQVSPAAGMHTRDCVCVCVCVCVRSLTVCVLCCSSITHGAVRTPGVSMVSTVSITSTTHRPPHNGAAGLSTAASASTSIRLRSHSACYFVFVF